MVSPFSVSNRSSASNPSPTACAARAGQTRAALATELLRGWILLLAARAIHAGRVEAQWSAQSSLILAQWLKSAIIVTLRTVHTIYDIGVKQLEMRYMRKHIQFIFPFIRKLRLQFELATNVHLLDALPF